MKSRWLFALFVVSAVATVVSPVRADLFDGLELYYGFNGDSLAAGGIKDLSGNGRDGSAIDDDGSTVIDVAFSNDVPAAVGSGSSLDLNVGQDFVRADSYTGIAGDGSRSISLWIKTENVANQHFVEWGTNAAGNRWTYRMENANNQGGVSTLGGTRTEIQTDYRTTGDGGPVINDGQWHHLAQVYSQSTSQLEDVRMFVDGVEILVLNDNPATPIINTIPLDGVAVGGSLNFDNRAVNGLIDEVGLWSRALTVEEVQSLAAGAVIPEPSSATLLLLAFTGLLAAARRR